MRFRRIALCLTSLLFAVGCGGDDVKIPENPAPLPAGDPELLESRTGEDADLMNHEEPTH